MIIARFAMSQLSSKDIKYSKFDKCAVLKPCSSKSILLLNKDNMFDLANEDWRSVFDFKIGK